MGDPIDYHRNRNGPRDKFLDEPAKSHGGTDIVAARPHQLESAAAREEFRRIMSWYYFERDRQSSNRMEMATDHDFYDGLQWDPDDEAVLADRGQMPLVYNEIAPMCDWLIGTERRNRVDWKILPRAEDDVQLADVKTKVLKYVTDINLTAFNRSRAFGDAIKGGIGWIDDGVRDDPTQDPIYGRYEDWRNVLHDSTSSDLLGDEGRYVFRWRWVDEDIACMMFPDRRDKIKMAVEDWAWNADIVDDEIGWGSPGSDASIGKSGTMSPLAGTSTAIDAQRRRVKLIECQYRKPVKAKFVADGPFRGSLFDERDTTLARLLAEKGGSIVDKVTMRVHVAVMTESDLLALGPSIYRHNKFSLTPVVCYRRSRDRQPYGPIRRVRGIQQDLNKRASKALWLLNTNQLIADRDAFDDPETAREEAQDPQGMLLKKAGSEVTIRRDTDAATGQMQIMVMDAQSIQKASGVTDENLGRRTNAVSGEAIKARQLQGSVVTTEPFDNLRMAVQSQGQKMLSLVEQFYSEEKVLRLTGAQGALEWVKINQPEQQDDGSVRYLNDITATMADFVVSEADYAGTLRQVMFDSLNQISQRLPPEIALKLLRMAYEFSDLPNKNEIVQEIRRLSGEPDPNKEQSPEEAAQAEQQAQAQAEAMQMQREQAAAVLEEQRAKAREINARAEKLLAEIDMVRAGGGGDADMNLRVEQAVSQVREQAATQIDTLSQKLAKATATNEVNLLKVRTDADSAAEVARIQAASAERVAEIQATSDEAVKALEDRLKDLTKMAGELQGTIKTLEKAAADRKAQPAPTPPPAAPPPAAPEPVIITVPGGDGGQRRITLERGADGKLVGATVKPISSNKEPEGD